MTNTQPFTPASHDQRAIAKAFKEPTSFLDAEHGRLAYYRFGRGPDVFFVHGFPLHAATFRKLVPELEKSFTLHMIDLPGTGNTEWKGPIDIESDAKVVRGAIDAIGLSRFAFVAHDSGGAIARYAALGDSRVKGMVLGNTEIPGHHSFVINAYSKALRIPGAGRLVMAAMRSSAVRRSAMGFAGCFSDPAYVDGEFGDWFIKPLLESPNVAAGQLELLKTLDFAVLDRLDNVHARIAAPVLCIWGPKDPFFPVNKARAMLPQFKGGAELVEIPGAKLFAHEDHAVAFAGHAAPFLARCLALPS